MRDCNIEFRSVQLKGNKDPFSILKCTSKTSCVLEECSNRSATTNPSTIFDSSTATLFLSSQLESGHGVFLVDVQKIFHHFNRNARTLCFDVRFSKPIGTVPRSMGGYFQGFKNAPGTDEKTTSQMNVLLPSLRVVKHCRQRFCKCCTARHPKSSCATHDRSSPSDYG